MLALRRAFRAAAIAWAAALPLATCAAARPHLSAAAYAASATVYAIGSVVCHQLPDRSFSVLSAQMPVCARCAGIYVGAAGVVLVAIFGSARLKPRAVVDRGLLKPRARSDRYNLGSMGSCLLLAIASLPTIVTLAYEWTTGVTPSNWTRAVAGVCLGIGVATVVEREVN